MKNGWQISLAMAIVVSLALAWVWFQPAKKVVKPLWEEEIKDWCVNQLCFGKNGDVWKVKVEGKEYVVDKDKIESVVATLESVRLEEVASNNPTKWQELGIKRDNRVVIKIKDKELEIGKVAERYDGTYVRQVDEELVYKINGVIDGEAITNLDFWRRNKVTNISRYQISKITVFRGEKSRELKHDEDRWENEEIVEKLTFLDGTNVVGVKPEWESGVHYVVEMDEGQNQLWLTTLKEDKLVRYLASDNREDVYKISRADFEKLTRWRL